MGQGLIERTLQDLDARLHDVLGNAQRRRVVEVLTHEVLARRGGRLRQNRLHEGKLFRFFFFGCVCKPNAFGRHAVERLGPLLAFRIHKHELDVVTDLIVPLHGVQEVRPLKAQASLSYCFLLSISDNGIHLCTGRLAPPPRQALVDVQRWREVVGRKNVRRALVRDAFVHPHLPQLYVHKEKVERVPLLCFCETDDWGRGAKVRGVGVLDGRVVHVHRRVRRHDGAHEPRLLSIPRAV